MWSVLEMARARTKGWSTLLRVDCTFITALEETSLDSDSSSVMDAAQASVPAWRSPRGWFSPVGMAWVMSQVMRSEERRVGKECRSRGPPYHYKKKIRKKIPRNRLEKRKQSAQT